jgi:glycerol-3-phosphate cytidylyltransferase-like family protein
METVVVSGSFDNIRSRDIRLLEESARFGPVHVCLWSDHVVERLTGSAPRFSMQERKYFLEAVRFVHQVWTVDELSDIDTLPRLPGLNPGLWVVPDNEDTPGKKKYCDSQEMGYQVLGQSSLEGFPHTVMASESPSSAKEGTGYRLF